jgi:hypothetical protein
MFLLQPDYRHMYFLCSIVYFIELGKYKLQYKYRVETVDYSTLQYSFSSVCVNLRLVGRKLTLAQKTKSQTNINPTLSIRGQ